MRFHHQIITILMTVLQAVGCAPALKDATAEPASVSWFDDYFTMEYIDATTVAIGEPRYHQQNYSYLIVGETRAVLFDTGPGVRSIKPVVDSLTTLPVIITQSHLHYDHIGGHHLFGGTALPDLPYLRGRVQSGNLQVKLMEHLGLVEGFRAPSLEVSEWWSDDSVIDLGGRALTVIHAPGHTKDSMILFDRERKLLFTGDFICPGPNAMLPGSDIEDYLESIGRLLDIAPPETRLLTAHRDQASMRFGAPVLNHGDLVDLGGALGRIRAGTLEGTGFLIKSYRVNDRIEMIKFR